MRYAKDGIFGEMNIMMNGQVLEEVEVHKYCCHKVIGDGSRGSRGRCRA